ncbi:MAG TPA: hypothetical protein VGL34_09870 [Steroidobacteraceae bacterium]
MKEASRFHSDGMAWDLRSRPVAKEYWSITSSALRDTALGGVCVYRSCAPAGVLKAPLSTDCNTRNSVSFNSAVISLNAPASGVMAAAASFDSLGSPGRNGDVNSHCPPWDSPTLDSWTASSCSKLRGSANGVSAEFWALRA